MDEAEKIQSLTSLGCSEARAREALAATNGNLEAAGDWIANVMFNPHMVAAPIADGEMFEISDDEEDAPPEPARRSSRVAPPFPNRSRNYPVPPPNPFVAQPPSMVSQPQENPLGSQRRLSREERLQQRTERRRARDRPAPPANQQQPSQGVVGFGVSSGMSAGISLGDASRQAIKRDRPEDLRQDAAMDEAERLQERARQRLEEEREKNRKQAEEALRYVPQEIRDRAGVGTAAAASSSSSSSSSSSALAAAGGSAVGAAAAAEEDRKPTVVCKDLYSSYTVNAKWQYQSDTRFCESHFASTLSDWKKRFEIESAAKFWLKEKWAPRDEKRNYYYNSRTSTSERFGMQSPGPQKVEKLLVELGRRLAESDSFSEEYTTETGERKRRSKWFSTDVTKGMMPDEDFATMRMIHGAPQDPHRVDPSSARYNSDVYGTGKKVTVTKMTKTGLLMEKSNGSENETPLAPADLRVELLDKECQGGKQCLIKILLLLKPSDALRVLMGHVAHLPEGPRDFRFGWRLTADKEWPYPPTGDRNSHWSLIGETQLPENYHAKRAIGYAEGPAAPRSAFALTQTQVTLLNNRFDEEHENPKGFRLKLRPEQLRSLNWMAKREMSAIEYKPRVSEKPLDLLPPAAAAASVAGSGSRVPSRAASEAGGRGGLAALLTEEDFKESAEEEEQQEGAARPNGPSALPTHAVTEAEVPSSSSSSSALVIAPNAIAPPDGDGDASPKSYASSAFARVHTAESAGIQPLYNEKHAPEGLRSEAMKHALSLQWPLPLVKPGRTERRSEGPGADQASSSSMVPVEPEPPVTGKKKEKRGGKKKGRNSGVGSDPSGGKTPERLFDFETEWEPAVMKPFVPFDVDREKEKGNFVVPFRVSYSIGKTGMKLECMLQVRYGHFQNARAGILGDAVGYGKTAVTIGLVDTHKKWLPPRIPKELAPFYIPTRATLIMVPANLYNQWLNEIKKFTQGAGHKVIGVSTVTPLKTISIKEIMEADFVVATYRLFYSQQYMKRVVAFARPKATNVYDTRGFSGNITSEDPSAYRERLRELESFVQKHRGALSLKWLSKRLQMPEDFTCLNAFSEKQVEEMAQPAEEQAGEASPCVEARRAKQKALQEQKAIREAEKAAKKGISKVVMGNAARAKEQALKELREKKDRESSFKDAQAKASAALHMPKNKQGEAKAKIKPKGKNVRDLRPGTWTEKSADEIRKEAEIWTDDFGFADWYRKAEIQMKRRFNHGDPNEPDDDDDGDDGGPADDDDADVVCVGETPKMPMNLENANAERLGSRLFPVFECFYWKRVVYDEFHELLGSDQKAQNAVRAIRAHFKWGLTGTPPVQRLHDIQRVADFFHFHLPADQRDVMVQEPGTQTREKKSLYPLEQQVMGQRFLNEYIRANTCSITKDIPQNDHNIGVVLSPGEQVLYLKTARDLAAGLRVDWNQEHGLNCHDAAALEGSSGESWRDKLSLEQKATLLKMCTHFSLRSAGAMDGSGAAGGAAKDPQAECVRVLAEKQKAVLQKVKYLGQLTRVIQACYHHCLGRAGYSTYIPQTRRFTQATEGVRARRVKDLKAMMEEREKRIQEGRFSIDVVAGRERGGESAVSKDEAIARGFTKAYWGLVSTLAPNASIALVARIDRDLHERLTNSPFDSVLYTLRDRISKETETWSEMLDLMRSLRFFVSSIDSTGLSAIQMCEEHLDINEAVRDNQPGDVDGRRARGEAERDRDGGAVLGGGQDEAEEEDGEADVLMDPGEEGEGGQRRKFSYRVSCSLGLGMISKYFDENRVTMRGRNRSPYMTSISDDTCLCYLLEEREREKQLAEMKAAEASQNSGASPSSSKSPARSSGAAAAAAAAASGGEGGGGEEANECPVCLESLDDRRKAITNCGHVFCLNCISQIAQSFSRHCPHCRATVSLNDIHELVKPAVSSKKSAEQTTLPEGFTDAVEWAKAGGIAPTGAAAAAASGEKKGKEEDELEFAEYFKIPHKVRTDFAAYGSKLCAIVEVLKRIRRDEPNAKAIIFCQYEDLKSKVSRALNHFSIHHSTLEGSIHLRRKTMDHFLDPQNTENWVLFLSLENSASGSNLQAANHVLFVHPMNAVNSFTAKNFEWQAIGRVRRQGQTKTVHVWRFISTNTVEEDICSLLKDSEWQKRAEESKEAAAKAAEGDMDPELMEEMAAERGASSSSSSSSSSSAAAAAASSSSSSSAAAAAAAGGDKDKAASSSATGGLGGSELLGIEEGETDFKKIEEALSDIKPVDKLANETDSYDPYSRYRPTRYLSLNTSGAWRPPPVYTQAHNPFAVPSSTMYGTSGGFAYGRYGPSSRYMQSSDDSDLDMYGDDDSDVAGSCGIM